MNETKNKGIILIVDDTPANLNLLSSMLTSHGYGVRPAPSGSLAIKAAKSEPPDLVLLDIKMPEMDGFEVCERLKSDPQLSTVPIIFISALTDTEDKIKAFKAGGVDFITKPFQIEEVVARVNTHLANRQFQIELNDKNRDLIKALEELKTTQHQLIQSEKMASLGILTAGIAHEINNPINFIKTSVIALELDMKDIEKLLNAYELFSQSLSAEQNRLLSDIKSNIEYPLLIDEIRTLVNHITVGVDRTEEIIESLRIYARMDEKKKTQVNLNDLLEKALVLLQNRYKNKISIEKQYGDLPEVMAESGRILQVFSNIIDNAIDAVTGENQHIPPIITLITAIGMRNDSKYAVVHVIDNGPPITPEIIDKMFDPFFTTKEIGKGTGLGMSISCGIIHEHKGYIDVTREEIRGTRISIFLPMGHIRT